MELPRRGLAVLLRQLFDLDNYTFKQQELVLRLRASCLVMYALRVRVVHRRRSLRKPPANNTHQPFCLQVSACVCAYMYTCMNV